MELVVFHYTLIVLLVSLIASASCLSSYLVSRNRAMLFAFAGFLFYFFDVAFVFQDEFMVAITGTELTPVYVELRSMLSLLTGAGCLASLWLLVCDYVGERRRAMLIAPVAAFVVVSFVVALLPASDGQRFAFWTMRQVFLVWMLLYVAGRYILTKNEVEHERLRRWRWCYLVAWVIVIGIVVEDTAFFLLFSVQSVQLGSVQFTTERNYMENLLVLLCAVMAFRHVFRTLSLRFDQPPVRGGARQDRQIDDNLMVYCARHGLSAREREVLQMVLQGKDNQNIASEMQLALSTVKVHVHNILQKTGQPNRQALIKDFWKTA